MNVSATEAPMCIRPSGEHPEEVSTQPSGR
jgi:hypothetical protein